MKTNFSPLSASLPSLRSLPCFSGDIISDKEKTVKTPDMSTPQDLPETLIYDYSNNKIRDLYKYFSWSKEAEDFYTKKVMARIDKGCVDSSNLEMILDLVEEGKLTPEVLYPIYGKIGRQVSSDLDKLYCAYADRKNVEEAFVPEFESESEALDALQTGEVCTIKDGKNIFVKKDDETVEELFISPKTYLRLFPPVERFIIKQSRKLGDCFFLATADSIYQNPKTRYKILEMFKENEDGTVDVVFGGFSRDENNETVPCSKENFVLKDVFSKTEEKSKKDFSSYTAEWARAIEFLYDGHLKKKADDELKTSIQKCEDLKQFIKDGKWTTKEDTGVDLRALLSGRRGVKLPVNEALKSKVEAMGAVLDSDFIYTKEELELYSSLINAGTKMASLSSKADTNLTYDMVLDELSKLDEKADKKTNDDGEDNLLRYKRLVLERYKERFERKRLLSLKVNECWPEDMFLDIFNIKSDFEKSYSNGGSELDILWLFGFDVKSVGTSISGRNKDFLFLPDTSEFVFTCSAPKNKYFGDFRICDNHLYSLEPSDVNGERKFIVRNPHNTMNEAIFTFEELLENFNKITTAKLYSNSDDDGVFEISFNF